MVVSDTGTHAVPFFLVHIISNVLTAKEAPT